MLHFLPISTKENFFLRGRTIWIHYIQCLWCFKRAFIVEKIFIVSFDAVFICAFDIFWKFRKTKNSFFFLKSSDENNFLFDFVMRSMSKLYEPFRRQLGWLLAAGAKFKVKMKITRARRIIWSILHFFLVKDSFFLKYLTIRFEKADFWHVGNHQSFWFLLSNLNFKENRMPRSIRSWWRKLLQKWRKIKNSKIFIFDQKPFEKLQKVLRNHSDSFLYLRHSALSGREVRSTLHRKKKSI